MGEVYQWIAKAQQLVDKSHFDLAESATIHDAASRGDHDFIRRELAAGVDPNEPGEPLEFYNEYTHETTFYRGYTPLEFAISSSGLHGKGPLVDTDQRREVINHAGIIVCVDVLLAAGASPNVRDSREPNSTPLHLATQIGRPDIVQRLLDAGADVDATNSWGYCALHRAVFKGNVDCVIVLIAAGAALDIESSVGTPLDLVLDTWDRPRITPHLLRAGCTATERKLNVVKNMLQSSIYNKEPNESYTYFLRVSSLGGFKQYEKAHRDRLVAAFAPKFASLPEDVVAGIMEFYAHLGFY